MGDKEKYERLLKNLYKKLARLRERQAEFGDNVPDSMTQEIEDLEDEIARIKKEKPELADQSMTAEEGSAIYNVEKVAGDKITGGDIDMIYGVDVKRSSTSQKVDREQLKKMFIPLMDKASNAPDLKREKAIILVNELMVEMMSNPKGNDEQVARMIDSLVKTLPESHSLVVQTFSDPAVKAMTGPMTHFMVERLETT